MQAPLNEIYSMYTSKPLIESIPLPEHSSFALREFKANAFRSPLHFHPEIELTYTVSGTARRVVGDYVGDFAAGDLVLIGPNLPHYCYSKEVSAGSCAHALVLQFHEACLGESFFQIPDMASIRKLLRKSRQGLSIHPSLRAEIGERMQNMLQLEGPMRVIELLLILHSLAGEERHVALASENFDLYADISDCERLNLVFQYVFENFTQELSLTEAASIASMSTSAFCYYFKNRTQRNFSQFVNQIRLAQARRLILQTDKTIAQVCYECGFNNLSNFNRRFREFYHTSPTEFKRQGKLL